MKKIYLKIALLLVCAVFISAGVISAQTDGDTHNGNFCLLNPTAIICQPTPTPCPPGETCPEGGGNGARSSDPGDGDDGSFWDSFWNLFGY